MAADLLKNYKGLLANLEQRYETDFMSFCSQNNVSQSFTPIQLNDETHQIYEIFRFIQSFVVLRNFKRLISKIILCMYNEFFLPQVITDSLSSWSPGNV